MVLSFYEKKKKNKTRQFHEKIFSNKNIHEYCLNNLIRNWRDKSNVYYTFFDYFCDYLSSFQGLE